nr:odorant-binding protein 2 [Plautia stali]
MNAALCLTTLLAVVCLSGAMSPEYKQKLMSSVSDCMKTHGLTKEEVIDIMKNEKLPEDKEKQCAVGCVMDKMGYVKDSTMDWDTVKAANPQKFDNPEDVEKANQVSDACAKAVSEKEADLCVLGVKAIKCIHENAAKFQLQKPEFSLE